MNVIIGVCGLGQGHTMRQKFIIDTLIARGHTLILTVYGQAAAFYKKHYPNIPQVEVAVPFIVCNQLGIDWIKTKGKIGNTDYFRGAIDSFITIDNFLHPIDIIISDYEPVCAQYAYANEIPLITMEQQSKFLGYHTEAISNYGNREESSRLHLFFPFASQRIAPSFFDLHQKKLSYDIQIVGPILCEDVLKLKKQSKSKIVIYFSPFSDVTEGNVRDMISWISHKTNYNIEIFVKEKIQNLPSQIKQNTFERNKFLDSLSKAVCLIANAGHQLISEAIYLGIPMFLLPLNTYEQHYNTKIVCQYRMGEDISRVSNDNLVEMINNAAEYGENIAKYRRKTQYCKRINNVVKLLDKWGL